MHTMYNMYSVCTEPTYNSHLTAANKIFFWKYVEKCNQILHFYALKKDLWHHGKDLFCISFSESFHNKDKDILYCSTVDTATLNQIRTCERAMLTIYQYQHTLFVNMYSRYVTVFVLQTRAFIYLIKQNIVDFEFKKSIGRLILSS